MARTPTKKAQPITTDNIVEYIHKGFATYPLPSVNGSDAPSIKVFPDAWLDLGRNVRVIIKRQDESEEKQKETDELLAGEKAKKAFAESALNVIKNMAWWQRLFFGGLIIEQVWVHGSAINWNAVGTAIKHLFGF